MKYMTRKIKIYHVMISNDIEPTFENFIIFIIFIIHQYDILNDDWARLAKIIVNDTK